MLLLTASSPALAQITYESKVHHKHLRKQFLKQAENTVTQYKDTHLDVSSYNFKKGEPGRTRVKSEKYQYGEGTAPEKKKRFFFWKKKEKKQQKKSSKRY
ncbi:hypothetical protein ACFSRY_04750 [Pontibacter locisalis]|uniref:Uncharacterized protein n=1 Tax=Pontibacter locisalis TaxID=1719035 RepID=A0ABW5IID4_9BACT